MIPKRFECDYCDKVVWSRKLPAGWVKDDAVIDYMKDDGSFVCYTEYWCEKCW